MDDKPSGGRFYGSAVLLLFGIMIPASSVLSMGTVGPECTDVIIMIGIVAMIALAILLIFMVRFHLLIMLLLSGSITLMGVGAIVDPLFAHFGGTEVTIIVMGPLIVISILLLGSKKAKQFYAYTQYTRVKARIVDGKVVLSPKYKPVTKRLKVDGGVYIGEVVKIDGEYLRHGCGQFECPEYVYIGEWHTDKRDGAGGELNNGQILQGVWREGLKNGWFRVDSDGMTEVGYYENDVRTGEWSALSRDDSGDDETTESSDESVTT